jgi:hypothetical protein
VSQDNGAEMTNRIWLDTEFLEEGQGWHRGIELLSLGAVKDDGSTFYGETKEGRTKAGSVANPWVRKHVVPQLWTTEVAVQSRHRLAERFAEWCGPNPEFWGYMAAYDWVAVTGLYGAMVDHPKTWPFFIRDLAQLAEAKKGAADWPEKAVSTRNNRPKHHALTDAIWTWDAWRILNGLGLIRMGNQH